VYNVGGLRPGCIRLLSEFGTRAVVWFRDGIHDRGRSGRNFSHSRIGASGMSLSLSHSLL
jgi:hypothetical protein